MVGYGGGVQNWRKPADVILEWSLPSSCMGPQISRNFSGHKLTSIRVTALIYSSFVCLPFWLSSVLVVFRFGRLPFWSSSVLVVFHFGRLPFWSSSALVVFRFGHLPFWSSSILVVLLEPFPLA